MSQRFILDYTSAVVGEPVIYTLIKNFDIKVNILRAEISSGQRGNMLVELKAAPEKLQAALDYLKTHSVELLPLSEALLWREADCINCGACTGVCFSGCLTMDHQDWRLKVDREQCIACGFCVKACPFGLFSLRFGD